MSNVGLIKRKLIWLKSSTLFLILALSVLLILSTGHKPTYGSTVTLPREDMSQSLRRLYSQTVWYPLIQSVEVEGNNLEIITYIYPDAQGKQLAQEIVRTITQNLGITGTVSIYGIDIDKHMLYTNKGGFAN